MPTAVPIDFSECENEPIRQPGSIQPHGHMLAVDAKGRITHASENIGQLFPIDARACLGLTLADVLGAEPQQRLHKVIAGLAPGELHQEVWEAGLEKCSFWIHERGGRHILEWERLPQREDRARELLEQNLSPGLTEIAAATQVRQQAQLATGLASLVTAFDRVLVYQFHRDWSGEVIAESRGSRADPLLGHRYPASDIPTQARKLYLENLLRVLVDSGGKAISILALPAENEPLDLTMSQLRAMSPYHLEYLRNTGVAATATASLICNGKLWGLLSCQHERHRQTAPSERRAVAEIARVLSQGIEGTTRRAREASKDRLRGMESALEETVVEAAGGLKSMLFGPQRLRSLVNCAGSAVWSATNGLLRMGETPSRTEIDDYALRLLSTDDDLFVSDSRADIAARLCAAPQRAALAGLMAVVISRNPALILFWFRLENLQEITWGGDINQPVLRDELTGRLSPRRSFALYKESVVGKSAEWTEENVTIARSIQQALYRVAPGPALICEMVDSGFRFARTMVTEDWPANNCALDAIGHGASLLISVDSGTPTLRYTNQTLQELAEIYSSTDPMVSDADALLDALGLSVELLSRSDMEPQAVVIPTLLDGFRHFLVERKLALEVVDRQSSFSMNALHFTDVTRSERAREALLAAQERAEHLASVRSSFLANMSHEIRTPMTGLLGMVELLQDTPFNTEQQQYLDVIRQSGQLLLSLINDVLDLSRIEAHGMELESKPFDLTLVVEAVVELLRPKAREKSIELSAGFDSPPPRWFEGDASRLQQVILNLTGNAVKFTAKGSVRLAIHCEATSPGQSLIVLSVSDTGIGIPPEQQNQVFEKFRQADSSTARRHGGTGLGLAIARDLIHLMGGSITLSSTVGVGSTFTVLLPIKGAKPPEVEPASEPATAAGIGGGRRILVTEDNKVNQLVIGTMLRKKGFEVAMAYSGHEALDFLEHNACDLILMDCQMAGLDGYETTALIRAKEGATAHTPIVALTADALSENRQRCLDAGMDDYLTKPIQVHELWETLRKWNCLEPDEPPKGPSTREKYAEPIMR